MVMWELQVFQRSSLFPIFCLPFSASPTVSFTWRWLFSPVSYPSSPGHLSWTWLQILSSAILYLGSQIWSVLLCLLAVITWRSHYPPIGSQEQLALPPRGRGSQSAFNGPVTWGITNGKQKHFLIYLLPNWPKHDTAPQLSAWDIGMSIGYRY